MDYKTIKDAPPVSSLFPVAFWAMIRFLRVWLEMNSAKQHPFFRPFKMK